MGQQPTVVISFTICVTSAMAVLRATRVFHVLHLLLQVIGSAYPVTVNVEVSSEMPASMATGVVQGIKEILASASKSLYTITDGRLSFREVIITVPATWHEVVWVQGSVLRSNSAQVLVAESPATVPRTVSGGGAEGCGRRGDFIELPFVYLLTYMQGTGESVEMAGKRMAVQWAKYWYGIYDEDDPGAFYYDESSGQYQPSFCSNQPIPGYSVDPNGEKCAVDEYGRPVYGCYFEMDIANVDATTSLLLESLVNQMTGFCDNSNHNKHAPTMQNRLCGGRSAWTIMNLGEIPQPGQVSVKDPSFTLVRRSAVPQVVISIEASLMSKPLRPFDGFLNSIVKMVTALENKATFSLIDFSEDNSIVLPWQQSVQKFITGLVDATNFLAVQTTLDRKSKHINCSVVCTADAALKILVEARPNKFEPAAILILMDASNDDNVSEYSSSAPRLTRALNGNNTSLLVVTYGGQPSKELLSLTKASGGGVFALHLDSNDQYVKIEDEEFALDEALHTALSFWDTGLQMVQHEMMTLSEAQTVVYKLQVDQDSAQKSSLMITSTPYTLDKVNIMRQSGNGSSLSCAPLHDESYVLICPLNFNLTDNAELNDYSVSVSVTAATALIFQLVTVTDPTLTNIKVSARLDTDSINFVQPFKSPVRIIATVRRGAIVPDTIMVNVITQHGTVMAGESVVLRDDGKDPDLFPHDGVLSGYLTKFYGDGNYACRILVTGIFKLDTDWAFERLAPTIYMTVDDGFLNHDSIDNIPPNAVIDLAMVGYPQVREEITTFTLRWTAPGDDLANGRAFLYELRVFTTWKQATEFWDSGRVVLIPLDTIPLPGGTEERFSLNISYAPGSTIFLALKCRDDASHWSPLSNVVIVNVPNASDGPETFLPITKYTAMNTTITESTTITNESTSEPVEYMDIFPILPTRVIPDYEEQISHPRAPGVNGVITSFIFLCIALSAVLGISIFMCLRARRALGRQILSMRQEVPYDNFTSDL